MKNYTGEEIKFTGCPGCAYAKHEFELPCGIAYQNERFTVSQDWELPIEGFYVICPVARHVEHFVELTNKEREEMFMLANEVMQILKDNNVCDSFNIAMQEKAGVHLHVWVYPQHNWIQEQFGDSMAHIIDVFNYAKNNLKTSQTFKNIKKINDIVKKELTAKHSFN